MPQPIRTLTTPPLTLAGSNKTYMVGPDPGMKEQWASFMTDFGKIEGQVGFAAYGVCHSFGSGLMDYLVGVEVKDAGQVPGYSTPSPSPNAKPQCFCMKEISQVCPKPGGGFLMNGCLPPNWKWPKARSLKFMARPSTMAMTGLRFSFR